MLRRGERPGEDRRGAWRPQPPCSGGAIVGGGGTGNRNWTVATACRLAHMGNGGLQVLRRSRRAPPPPLEWRGLGTWVGRKAFRGSAQTSAVAAMATAIVTMAIVAAAVVAVAVKIAKPQQSSPLQESPPLPSKSSKLASRRSRPVTAIVAVGAL